MTFETAASSDIEELVGLRIEYLLEDYGEIPQDKLALIAENLPAYFHCHLNRDLIAFICKSENETAGCCFLLISEKPSNPSFVNGKTGTVLNVYTRPQFRRKGISRELMKLLLAESKKRGLDYVELKATDSGYDLYRSLGFEDAVSKYREMKYIIDPRDRTPG